MLIFAIQDTKADAFLQPFFCETQAVAIRLLKKPCNDGQHNFCVHAGDYHLYELGSFEEATGEINCWPKKHITGLDALVDQVEPVGLTSLQGGE